MPAGTRERALEAAVELLGRRGVRALSHARVDERAGLPRGSTSNWFRTRRALLEGVVDWIAERERSDLGPAGMPPITGVDALVDGLCAMIELQSGRFAARTRARYALFLELAADPELGEPLRRQRHEFERWTEDIVTDVGIEDPRPATRALMALADGLLLHRLTVDPALDVRPAVTRAVRDLARTPDPGAGPETDPREDGTSAPPGPTTVQTGTGPGRVAHAPVPPATGR
ncbi:TetR/AcrR family transcriptional regulator [Ornithinimicrobium sp. W1665]|uniref:TetR/AcrR family transcriptional regulator n=1 Tax=Ornithinimicrobium sp. W1665 TaxID=3416666 RepID=UPI003CFB0530